MVCDMRVNEIKIFPCFRKNPPRPEKLRRKEEYFQKTGALESEIVLDGAGNLIDGYTSYLIAKNHGLDQVAVRYGRRQVILAEYKPGGNPYCWELPGNLVGRVSIGDRVLAWTVSGPRRVTVTGIREYDGEELASLKMVIKHWGKGVKER